MDSTIGKRIRQLREAKGLSVADFAKCAGVKPSAIYGLESDANKPSIETVSMLRQSFPDLNSEWLQFGDGPMLRDGRTLTPAPATQSNVLDEPADEARMPATVKRKMHTPMAVVRDVESMTKDEQIDYYRALAEMAEERAAAAEAAQRHETAVRLVRSAGGQSFTSASPETADTYQPAAMAISYVAPEYRPFKPSRREPARTLIGYGRG